MIVLRLQRGGKKKEPHYRVVAMDQKKATTAQAKEILGHYHPCDKENQITLNIERVDYWLSVGAKPSETVEDLIRKAKGEKPLQRKHVKVSKKAKEKAATKAKTAQEEKETVAKAKSEEATKPAEEVPAETPKVEEIPAPAEEIKEETKEEVKEEAPKVEEKQPEPQPQPQPEEKPEA
ncbi:MAG: 30S ribosomal protein S16 [Elusimicrobiaceae bacterium]|jgi:small subunit ribosomal protein S16|nr:30S ribosomal protein S16 [Elusimicrobiaceae bacterium]MBT3955065.1 30S ribosomal protein S16 [Elusimicrobiaceae bacterium]MBT4402856.1 30S ribosomal protein S16 [Elusimicrobiaceae bacterium]MBT4439515.1 30S ribosomal protein S16 [Elusimicrobiaceae bacterium]MBT5987255.1 30S ribosomal protein S16 [Elusimicrobiaceae bacterium]